MAPTFAIKTPVSLENSKNLSINKESVWQEQGKCFFCGGSGLLCPRPRAKKAFDAAIDREHPYLWISSKKNFHGYAGVISFAFPGIPQVRCAFTTALRGNLSLDALSLLAPSAETGIAADASGHGENRAEACLTVREAVVSQRVCLQRELGLSAWSELRQVHKDVCLANPVATAPNAPSSLEGDGHYTNVAGHALVIKTADCQPILLAHGSGKYIAALHVGWRGNALDFPTAGVAAFCREYDLSPADVYAVRGPSLGPAAAEFVNFDTEWPERFRPWFCETARTMDLWSLTRCQLIAAGLLPERIFSVDLCTHSLPGFLFSYRRGHAERHMNLIWREESPAC